MSVLDSPLGKRLLDSERILIAGAGGGYDVYCGLRSDALVAIRTTYSSTISRHG